MEVRRSGRARKGKTTENGGYVYNGRKKARTDRAVSSGTEKSGSVGGRERSGCAIQGRRGVADARDDGDGESHDIAHSLEKRDNCDHHNSFQKDGEESIGVTMGRINGGVTAGTLHEDRYVRRRDDEIDLIAAREASGDGGGGYDEPENQLVPRETMTEAEKKLFENLETVQSKALLQTVMEEYGTATGNVLTQNDYNTTQYVKFTCESHVGCQFQVCFARAGDALSQPSHSIRHTGDRIEINMDLEEDVELRSKVRGNTYADIDELCKIVEDQNDELGIKIKRPRNTRSRVLFACNQHIACPFAVSIQRNTRGEFAVSSKSNFSHTQTHYQGRHRRKNCKILNEVAARCATRTSNLVADDIIRTAEADNGKIVSYANAYNAKQRHEKKAKQSAAESCELIGPWLEEMRRMNKNTHCAYVRDPTTHEFCKAFIAFGAMQPVVERSLPVIVLDAAHMKGPQHGIMNAATVVTGNNENLVIATAVQACTESEQSWSWFLDHLLQAYPALRTKAIVVISDRDKGLRNACRVFEDAPHSFCTVHIKRNVKSNCRVDLEKLVHKLATEFDKDKLDEIWREISDISSHAKEYLKAVGDESWMSSVFPRRRYGLVTSNPAEITNSWLDESRKKTFFGCLVSICDKMRKRMFDLAKAYKDRRRPLSLTDHAAEKVKEAAALGRRRHVTPSSEMVFSVSSSQPGVDRVVDLRCRTCSCGRWNEFEIPCLHVCAVLYYRLSVNMQPQENNPALFTSRLHYYDYVRGMYQDLIIPVDISLLERDRQTKLSSFSRGSKASSAAGGPQTATAGRRREKRFPSRGE